MSRLGEFIIVFCVIVITGIAVGPHLPKVSCIDWWPLKAVTCIVH